MKGERIMTISGIGATPEEPQKRNVNHGNEDKSAANADKKIQEYFANKKEEDPKLLQEIKKELSNIDLTKRTDDVPPPKRSCTQESFLRKYFGDDDKRLSEFIEAHPEINFTKTTNYVPIPKNSNGLEELSKEEQKKTIENSFGL